MVQLVPMMLSTSKREVTAACWKMVDCSLWVGSESLPQSKGV